MVTLSLSFTLLCYIYLNTAFVFSFPFQILTINDEMKTGVGEETIEPNEGNQGPKACPQHLRR